MTQVLSPPDTFLEKYGIDQEAMEATGLSWDDLTEICEDYVSRMPSMEPTANSVAAHLRKVDTVHSLKIRLKDPEHVIEKIIRKKKEDPSIDVSLENYRELITDLIGVRALHLLKEEWVQIHDFVTETWDLQEDPTANIRKGDPEEEFRQKGCVINIHPAGYRSVHYLVKCQGTKELHIVEIQVRTIFEEGWSEIDHRVRYPYSVDDHILNRCLSNFNRLAGAADEWGSFVIALRRALDERSKKVAELRQERTDMRTRLEDTIRQLKISEQERKDLQVRVDELLTAASTQVTYPSFFTLGPTNHVATERILNYAAPERLVAPDITEYRVDLGEETFIPAYDVSGGLTCPACGYTQFAAGGLVYAECPKCGRSYS